MPAAATASKRISSEPDALVAFVAERFITWLKHNGVDILRPVGDGVYWPLSDEALDKTITDFASGKSVKVLQNELRDMREDD